MAETATGSTKVKNARAAAHMLVEPGADPAARRRWIEERAYQIWEDEGRPHGRHDAHWQQAEREVAAAPGSSRKRAAPSPRTTRLAAGGASAARPIAKTGARASAKAGAKTAAEHAAKPAAKTAPASPDKPVPKRKTRSPNSD